VKTIEFENLASASVEKDLGVIYTFAGFVLCYVGDINCTIMLATPNILSRQ